MICCSTIFTLQFEPIGIEHFHRNGRQKWPCHFTTSFPLDIYWGGGGGRFIRMLLIFHCTTNWYELLRLELHPSCLQRCGLNLNTNEICVGLLAVPSVNIGAPLIVSHKKLVI